MPPGSVHAAAITRRACAQERTPRSERTRQPVVLSPGQRVPCQQRQRTTPSRMPRVNVSQPHTTCQRVSACMHARCNENRYTPISTHAPETLASPASSLSTVSPNHARGDLVSPQREIIHATPGPHACTIDVRWTVVRPRLPFSARQDQGVVLAHRRGPLAPGRPLARF